MSAENVSQDLIWELVRNNNSYLAKRKYGGGIQLSRDPMNLTNKHSRKYEGFVNNKAIGVNPRPATTSSADTGIVLTTKRPSRNQTPGTSLARVDFGPNTSGRKTNRGIVNRTAKNGYRPDLRAEAVARASQIKRSQKGERKMRDQKARGSKARANAAKEEAS